MSAPNGLLGISIAIVLGVFLIPFILEQDWVVLWIIVGIATTLTAVLFAVGRKKKE